MQGFFAELKRRNVFRVAVAYVIVAWLIAQVADLALENFGAPDWVIKTILLLLILGLPVAVVFAWAFELTPEGIKREKDVDREQSETARTGQRLNYAIIGLLAVALAYFVYESRFHDAGARVDETQVVAEQAAKSIAVLPFATFGDSEADSYLSDGLAETLLNLLAQIDELQVAARTSAFKFKNTNEDIRIIGEQLGVATVLEGSVQRAGDRIRITAQLVSVADGFHMYSETFERELDDIFAIQDEIAQAVVAALKVKLLGAPSTKVDVHAYETLAGLRSRLRTATADDMEALIASLDALTRNYPDYADAHATLAEAYTLHGQGAGLIPEPVLAKAIDAGQRAIDVAPGNPNGYIALGKALIARGRFTEADPVVERALALKPGDADVMVMEGQLLAIENRYQEAFEITKRALLRDPLNPDTRVNLATHYRNVGRIDEGIAMLDLGLELAPEDISLLTARASLLSDSGRLGAANGMLEHILEIDPKRIGAAQERFYVYYNVGDVPAAAAALEEAEALSRERLADERAIYCYATGDTECWHAATTRMLATRNRFFVQAWQARMLYEEGLIEDAIDALLPVVEYFDNTNDWYGNFQTRTNLAALYQLDGNEDLRDEALRPVIDAFDTSVANGYEHWELYFDLAAAKAARGDADEAMRLLEECYARGFRHPDNIIYRIALDSLRVRPDFQAFVDRIHQANAAALANARRD